MAYEAGNLLVTINGSAQGANASINSTIKHLNALKTAITQLTSVDTTASSKIVAFFTDLGNGIKKIDKKSLESIANLGTSIKSLSSIASLSKLGKLDWDKVASGFGKLTTAITPFIDKVKEAETSLNSLYGILQKTGGNTKNRKGKKSSTDKLFNLAKITMFYRMAKRVGSAVANIVQYGVDYTETLNLWTVAMRDNLTQADEFIKKMNRAYGISEKTLMNSQAIFKNMLGSLGQISGDKAYALSEALVQMSADFASLYNVSFQSALTKIQAMLAGQVRPIRSAGLDITETTLFQYYQAMGGTKTMRQLTRTEKQLLSIYAVFQQMSSAGALGDMQKTLNQFANQSRMINDNFQTMLTWAGVIGKKWIENTGILVYVNAVFITMGDILRAIAGSMNAIDSEDFLNKQFEATQNTNKEMDELQGKLLDFDKFRSLNGAEQNALGIDEKLLEAISGYDKIIDETKNDARMIADSWLEILGWERDASGELVPMGNSLDKIKNTIKVIGIGIGVIAGFGIVAGIGRIVKAVFTLKNALTLLNGVLVVGVVVAIVKAVEAFKNGDYWTGILATTIGVVLVGAFIALNAKMIKTIGIKIISFFQNIQLQGALAATGVQKLQSALGYLGIALGAAMLSFTVFSSILSALPNDTKKVVGPIFIVVGALTALLGVILAIKGGLKGGLAGAIVAGVGLGGLLAGIMATSQAYSKPVEAHALGASDIDGGSLFIAGEAGKTEAVFNGSNGKTNVANISQMQQAFYGALVQYGRENRDSGSPIVVQIDGNKVFEATRRTANKRGLDFKRV